MRSPLRIGAVSYLNTRPLIYGLHGDSEYSLSLDVPSALAEKLRQGDIDVGLIPIVEYFRGVGDSILPGICIASDGPVRTVKLFSRVHPQKLTSVAVDSGSRTSVALLRILLSERFNVTPDFHSYRADLREMLRVHEAALLIGDPAFTESGAPFVWDLGEGWRDLTGLPFVFATWVLQEGVDVGHLKGLLRSAKIDGLTHLESIASDAEGLNGLDRSVLLAYLRDTLHYNLGAREQRGIETFQKLCRRYNIIPGIRELKFADANALSVDATEATTGAD